MAGVEIVFTTDFDRNFLCGSGLTDIEKFWDVETASHMVEYKHLRVVKDSNDSSERQTTCIRARGTIYYVKKASGIFYSRLLNEFNALNILASIGVLTPILSAYFMDGSSARGLLVYKNLAGFNSLKKLFDGNASPDALADFQMRKKQIIRDLASTREKIVHSGYLYNEWDSDHIFVKYRGPGIVLADFELFETVAKLPWTRRNPLSLSLIRMREWKNFKQALRSKVYTDSFLKKILRGE